MKLLRSLGKFKYALLLALFAGLYSSVRTDLEAFRSTIDNRLSNSTRLEDASRFYVEYQNFLMAMDRFVRNDAGVSHDKVVLAFDILWSRTESLSAARDYEFVQAIDKEQSLFTKAKFALGKADPEVAALARGDELREKKILQFFHDVEPKIADFAQEAYHIRTGRALDFADEQRKSTIKLDHMQMAILVIGLLIPFLMTIELLKIRRLNTRIKVREREIIRLGLVDVLTSLGNRRALMDELRSNTEAPGSNGGYLLLIDLDGFKAVNDNYGHPVGDELLKLVAIRLMTIVGMQGVVCRLGGDEFAIVLRCSEADAVRLAEEMIANLTLSYVIQERTIGISASIGISHFANNDEASAIDALGDADVALYAAKKMGRSCYQLFESKLRDQVSFQNTLSSSLSAAIENDEITVHYQPQISLTNGKITGVEALARWHHSELGHVSPEDFVRTAEQLGIIKQLDFKILTRAAQDIRLLNQAGANLRLSFNVSPLEAGRKNYAHELLELVTELRFPRNRLTIELTENAVMEDFDAVAENLTILADAGIKIAIDDFGSGYSNLSYLTRLPFNFLKVDKRLAAKIDNSAKDRAVLESINHLAKNLNLNVILEGIETSDQLYFATTIGIQEGQGFYISQPMSIEKLTAFLPEYSRKGHEPGRKNRAA